MSALAASRTRSSPRRCCAWSAVPGLDRPAALITLDNGFDHTKPNTFGPAGLASLDAAIDEALAADPAFIAVTGKPYIFCVGADLTGMPLLTDREQALEIGRLGPPGLRAGSRDSTVPDLRVRQRRGDGRRPGAGAALPLPHALRAARRRSRCPRSRSAWSPAGAARSCCRT